MCFLKLNFNVEVNRRQPNYYYPKYPINLTPKPYP